MDWDLHSKATYPLYIINIWWMVPQEGKNQSGFMLLDFVFCLSLAQSLLVLRQEYEVILEGEHMISVILLKDNSFWILCKTYFHKASIFLQKNILQLKVGFWSFLLW